MRISDPTTPGKGLGAVAIGTAMLFAALVAAPKSGASTLVDDHGRVFTVQTGAYGELFPQGSGCPATQPVMALESVEPDGAASRTLVDGTCDPAVESEPLLQYEESAETLYLVWQSTAASGLSKIRLALLPLSEAGAAAAEVVDVTEDPVPLRGRPRLALTRDLLSVAGENDEVVQVDRRILHVVWSQGERAETAAAMYAPIILLEGEFSGWIPRFSLLDFPAGAAGSVAGPFSVLDLEEPELVVGADAKSVVVGYYHPGQGSVVAMEIRQLPAVLSTMAAAAARSTVEIGSELLNQPGGIEVLAGEVGARIIEMGFGLHLSVRAYLAAEVEQLIREEGLAGDAPGIPLDQLSDAVGARVIEFGSRVFGNDGLAKIYQDDRLSVVAVPAAPPQNGGASTPQTWGEGLRHLLRFYAASSRRTPDLEGVAARFLTSPSGEHGLLCWQGTASEVRYRESEGGGWGPVRILPVGPDLSHEEIQRILRERVEKR